MTAAATKKALIAEDNATVRLLVEAVIRRLGFEATVVSDGAQAQSRVFAEHPDLFVVDILLPGVSGLMLIGTLKAIKPNAKVIAISGMGETAKAAALSAGADDFLAKPFTGDDLERTVIEVCQ